VAALADVSRAAFGVQRVALAVRAAVGLSALDLASASWMTTVHEVSLSCHSFWSLKIRWSEHNSAGQSGLTRRAVARSFIGGPRRPKRSKQGTERARAVRRLGAPAGTGGKANCLCLWGTWGTPKPRYREETEPVERGCLGPPSFSPITPITIPFCFGAQASPGVQRERTREERAGAGSKSPRSGGRSPLVTPVFVD
jgi:hypothetical protein